MVTRVPPPSAQPRSRMRILLASGAAALALAAGSIVPGMPVGAAPQQAQAADNGKTTLTVAVAQSVDSLSPFLAQRLMSTSVHRLMYDFLTNYDPKDNHTVPGLATKWEPSADKLTWTYTIRSNSKWSDGQQATAEDAAWTFNKMMTDEGAATANGSFVANFKKVTAPSPEKLVIELKQPQATMAALDVPIVPKHVWEKVGDFSKFNNDTKFPIVGNGPYILTDYKVDQYVKLKANKSFWRGAPKFDELVFKTYKDQDAAVAALRKGEVSFVAGAPALTPAQAASLKGDKNIKVNEGPGRRFFALATNPGAQTKDGKKFGDGNKALLDQKVRQALFLSIDRKTIIDKVFQGHAVEGQGYIPPRFSDYFWQPSDSQKLSYDPDRAGKLLDQAGYKLKGDQRVGKDGKPLDLRILCHATDPNDKAIGKYLKEWWGKLGIGLKVDCRDDVSVPWYAGEYDLAFDGWSVNPDPDFVLGIHTCSALPAKAKESAATDNFICDKTYDELYKKQLAEYDPAKRADIVKQMESWMYDSGYMNIIAYPNAVEAYRTDQIKSITTMPEAAGNIYGQDGYWSWWSAVPAAADGKNGSAADSGGSSTGVVIGIVVAVVVVAGGGFLLARRRRSTAEERE
ncbi:MULTISPECIES: ABC transporter substrate-binding protein [unclassified Streptomyces]|uniref:ABC transporter substrate-binding protein n=1 Tax=unclassified Streptomyces TaxID=2593676 RepID=UPI002DD8A2D8|nr:MULTISPECIES: ABC transporter substrate-binding protein [unclassified Streptomyces]WSF84107.1 ABC transporter substrate-binding protein [Streptomyces sp. NBC_01744]WSC39608.1 ABC transporter substrate-binding protein [Streptomyces sp. NBC_01763]WSC47747.1 ABC transporter substrate-binding protein [Streptomyces sp. NBC_01762]WSC53265.1 ABC transporter substrate-binding protein [Streptomyces sp. NBC_01761]WSD27399.1 ABC transporter substrate-binding protein [Streptomyces sp. NBC_01751]